MGMVLSGRRLALALVGCGLVAVVDFLAFADWPGAGAAEEVEVSPAELLALIQADQDAQEAFYAQVLEPAIFERLEHYPVPVVHSQLIEVIGLLRSDQIALGHRASYPWEELDTVAQALVAFDGRPVISFEVRPIMLVFPIWKTAGIADDVLAEILLHEYYHVQHHLGHLAQDSLELRRRDESEAWFYTCSQVLQPMLNAGRFPSNQMDGVAATVYNAYYLSGGDSESPIWSAMIAAMYPALESENEAVRGSP